MELDATFWAFAALVIFLALMVYLKVPGQMAKGASTTGPKNPQ